MPLPKLVLRYTIFAALASFANLSAQRMVLALGIHPHSLPTALVVGTATGLVLKYMLDKRWIFNDRATGFRAHRDRFTRYSLMGIATTALFWVTETSCWLLWRRDDLRELGALLGLGVGYLLKYHLDCKFVFGGTANTAGGPAPSAR
jgi:putative flippase GtrA